MRDFFLGILAFFLLAILAQMNGNLVKIDRDLDRIADRLEGRAGVTVFQGYNPILVKIQP